MSEHQTVEVQLQGYRQPQHYAYEFFKQKGVLDKKISSDEMFNYYKWFITNHGIHCVEYAKSTIIPILKELRKNRKKSYLTVKGPIDSEYNWAGFLRNERTVYNRVGKIGKLIDVITGSLEDYTVIGKGKFEDLAFNLLTKEEIDKDEIFSEFFKDKDEGPICVGVKGSFWKKFNVSA